MRQTPQNPEGDPWMTTFFKTVQNDSIYHDASKKVCNFCDLCIIYDLCMICEQLQMSPRSLQIHNTKGAKTYFGPITGVYFKLEIFSCHQSS